MKEEQQTPTPGERIWNQIQNVLGVISWIIIVLSIVWMTIRIIKINHERALIKDDPVSTEAIITRIADPTKGGLAVYYEYQVKDSVYHDYDRPGNKTVKTLSVGQKIPITYQRTNPSNSMMQHEKLFGSSN